MKDEYRVGHLPQPDVLGLNKDLTWSFVIKNIKMKRILMLGIGIIMFAGYGHAQKTNTDSLKLVARLSEEQLKLGKMQNEVIERTKDKQDAAAKAQASADENQKVANELSTNAQDKSLARKASRKASAAPKDARRARIAADKLDDLNKDIEKQKEKIAKYQTQLGQSMPAPMVTPAAAPADSAHR